MSNERLYVDFHVIQTVPPSCVNRDDTGRPKTAVYGGANRARVSSQSWKHAMRLRFKDIFTSEEVGLRTKRIVGLIANEIVKLDESIDDEKAEKLAVTALEKTKVKTKNGTETGALFFISMAQVKKLAELAVNGETKDAAYKEAINSAPSVDIALFGRMVADSADLNVDASAQVAHSISTHAVQNEYDYFTAIDDCSPEDNAGAGHLGTMEFNSSTLYRYATVNVTDLSKLLGSETANAVKGFAEAFICSMPTGKQNSYANGTLPDAVYVTIRKDMPVNLVGAFEKPIQSNAGYAEKSIKALSDYAQVMYENYSNEPEAAFALGTTAFSDAKKMNLSELLAALYDYVVNEVI